MNQPVPRLELSRRISAGLWVLRLFVLAISGLVVYVFVAGVVRGNG